MSLAFLSKKSWCGFQPEDLLRTPRLLTCGICKLRFLTERTMDGRHTTNFQNQRRVFEAEEAQKKREKLDAERKKTLEQVSQRLPPSGGASACD
jgi:hypothetical protein